MICESGSELAKSLNVTASVSASYAGVSVSSSAQYDDESSVKSAHMYGIYSLDSRSYSVYRDGHKLERDDFDKELIEAAEKLPPWDKTADILKVYTEFFNEWGTHVIGECYLGARCQLTIEIDEQSEEEIENFKVYVKAKCKGVVSASGDASVKKTEKYKQYEKHRNTTCLVRGGPQKTSVPLTNDPANAQLFKEWSNSLDGKESDLIRVRVDSIGNLLKSSSTRILLVNFPQIG